jgi:glycosyltransferase involved in cell wall biosynthesis
MKINVLFIENSVGLAGSTMSLCSLLNFLDDELFRPHLFQPHIVLSREEQERYLLGQMRRPGDMTVITLKRTLDHTDWVQRVLGWVERCAPWLRRGVIPFLGVIEFFAVTFPYVLELRRWAKDRKIDLIHHNNGFDLPSLILSYLLRVPLVAYQRGDERASRLARWLAPRVTRYIANSAATKQNLISLGVRPRQVRVIYPPLDLSTFDIARPASLTRAAFGVPDSSPCFGIVGLLVPWKGQDVFLRAVKRVLEKVPDAYAFVIGGPPSGGVDYQESLRALAAELGIMERLIFTGYRADVPDILRLLDVVAHASILPEPFGRVIAEAMAMGRPVVASNAGGPTEIIEDDRTGFLVPPHDDEALAARITSLLQDPVMAKRIGEAGRRTVINRFSAERHAQLVKDVYTQALGPRWRGRVPERPAQPQVRPVGRGR